MKINIKNGQKNNRLFKFSAKCNGVDIDFLDVNNKGDTKYLFKK